MSVVVGWFGTNMDAGSCVVLPGVEYQTGATTSPATWGVAGFTRSTAHQITLIGGSPQFGGTPDDGSGIPPSAPTDMDLLQRVSAELGDEILGPPGALPD